MELSPLNFRCQSAWLMMIVGAACSTSSPAAKGRPRNGATRSTLKKSRDTSAPSIRSGSPTPFSVRPSVL